MNNFPLIALPKVPLVNFILCLDKKGFCDFRILCKKTKELADIIFSQEEFKLLREMILEKRHIKQRLQELMGKTGLIATAWREFNVANKEDNEAAGENKYMQHQRLLEELNGYVSAWDGRKPKAGTFVDLCKRIKPEFERAMDLYAKRLSTISK